MLKSRIPQIAAELPAVVDLAVKMAAELVEDRAKDRAPVATGRLREGIHTNREKLAEYRVVGGDDEAWYGHLVEFGTTHTSPHPFLTPAAEESRDETTGLVAEAIRRAA